MPHKDIEIENLNVKIYKRRNARNLSIRIDKYNNIRVSIPYYSSYRTGVAFARSKKTWLDKHYQQIKPLTDGLQVGKAHRLVLNPHTNKLSAKINANEIIVSYPDHLNFDNPQVQKAAKSVCNKALKVQAEALLQRRIDELSTKYNLPYKDLRVKKMRSRWGSCDQAKNITLNSQLMLLPWTLIDYVIVHELTHTKVLKHDHEFWQTLLSNIPNAKIIRRQLRQHKVEPITI